MVANDPTVDRFVGGTVYPAFCSALNHHGWHSPVAGTIVRAFVHEGTYFSEADSEGSDGAYPTTSGAHPPHVAARAMILIQADNRS